MNAQSMIDEKPLVAHANKNSHNVQPTFINSTNDQTKNTHMITSHSAQGVGGTAETKAVPERVV